MKESDKNPDFLPFDFDDELFTPGLDQPRLSKRQRRSLNRHAMGDGDPLDLSHDALERLQRADPTIASLRANTRSTTPNTQGYFLLDGIRYRRWQPTGTESTLITPVDQLVLPPHYRSQVLHLSHSIPLAGHLGVVKTSQPILQRFYWPTQHRDVKTFCNTCAECQKKST